MSSVFASASMTMFFFFLATLAMAYSHGSPENLHMLLGFFVGSLLILFQCLIFGFFIGSGKSIKRVVEENNLNPDWIQKTKDYKNQCYPALMSAIGVLIVAMILGGGVAVGAVPLGLHEIVVWVAFGVNFYSWWVTYRVMKENINVIHLINREVKAQKKSKEEMASLALSDSTGGSVHPIRPN